MLAFTEHTFGLSPMAASDAGAYDYANSFDFNLTPTAAVAMTNSRSQPASSSTSLPISRSRRSDVTTKAATRARPLKDPAKRVVNSGPLCHSDMYTCCVDTGTTGFRPVLDRASRPAPAITATSLGARLRTRRCSVGRFRRAPRWGRRARVENGTIGDPQELIGGRPVLVRDVRHLEPGDPCPFEAIPHLHPSANRPLCLRHHDPSFSGPELEKPRRR